MTATTLDTIAESHAKARAEADAAYRSLVETLARGGEPDDAPAVLSAADLTPDDLRADVERLHRRIELAAQLAEADKAEAERDKLRAKLDAADAKLEAAQDEHDRAVRPILAKLRDLERVDTLADRAATELRQTASVALRAEAADAQTTMARIAEQRRDLLDRVKRVQAQLATADPDDIPAIEKRVGALREQVDATDKALAEAQAVADDIARRMLNP